MYGDTQMTKLLLKLHNIFPKHIPVMNDFVYEVMVKGNQELLERSIKEKYFRLALDALKQPK